MQYLYVELNGKNKLSNEKEKKIERGERVSAQAIFFSLKNNLSEKAGVNLHDGMTAGKFTKLLCLSKRKWSQNREQVYLRSYLKTKHPD